jgi:hypothetical protein
MVTRRPDLSPFHAAELRESSFRMFGRAAMIAVLLAPTASIARHDDHRTDANPVRCFNVAASSPRHRADETRPRPPRACITFFQLLLHPMRSDVSRSAGL